MKGSTVGALVGLVVGVTVGVSEGDIVGVPVGDIVGSEEGLGDGAIVEGMLSNVLAGVCGFSSSDAFELTIDLYIVSCCCKYRCNDVSIGS